MRTLLIPLAAFAVTVAGSGMFDVETLQAAGLTNDQVSAFETARELRRDGERERARDVLIGAGIDAATVDKLRRTMGDRKKRMQSAMDTALQDDDYDAFVVAAEGSPLADIITSKQDFELLREARQLEESGEYEEAEQIMDELRAGPLSQRFVS